MPRPRTIDDERLLAAAQEILFTNGPAGFTLERAAAHAGMSAATLIKRFGSKKELLVALSRRWIASIEPGIAAVVQDQSSAYAQLRAAALWGFDDLDTPANAANQSAALALDLQDDDLRALLAEGWGLVQARLAQLVGAAIAAGELPEHLDAAACGRLLFTAGEGTRLAWSVDPRGSLTARAEETIDLALAGLRGQR